jgi:hypothetical protein
MRAEIMPTPEPQDGAAPDPRQRTVELIESLLSTGRSVAEVLEETQKLANSSTFEPTVATEGELSAPEASAMGQQCAVPRRRARIWLISVACLIVLAAAAGAAVLHLPVVADANPPAAAFTSTPRINSDARDGQANRVQQKLAPEQVSLLIDRGDALVGMGDLSSARLFYERAAAAGNAQAALRLGATFDPSFLRGAGLRGIGGDEGMAAYWYGRARDLGAASASPQN